MELIRSSEKKDVKFKKQSMNETEYGHGESKEWFSMIKIKRSE